MHKLKIDPQRVGIGSTGIFVRAQDDEGRWLAADIVELDKESLLAFLKYRGGDNIWAESTCLILLGHQP